MDKVGEEGFLCYCSSSLGLPTPRGPSSIITSGLKIVLFMWAFHDFMFFIFTCFNKFFLIGFSVNVSWVFMRKDRAGQEGF